MALAASHPEKVYKRNKGVVQMTLKQLHEFARTPRMGLPARKRTR